MVTKTLNGPGGLTIELDSAQIFPDDPGQGTPAMVYLLGGAEATYWWAADNGSLYTNDGRDIELSSQQCNWLHAQEDAVAEFIDSNS